MRKQARYYSARRAPSSLRVHVDHRYERDMQSTYWDKGGDAHDLSYVANLSVDDDG